VDGIESPPSDRIAADRCPARKGNRNIDVGVEGDVEVEVDEVGDEGIEDMRSEGGSLGWFGEISEVPSR
jgi:hypothetical protein